MRMPTPIQMETICTVARLRTFTEAAAALNTTQPAVSSRVREVEEMIGADLFVRNGRYVELTLKGRHFVESVEPLLGNLRELIDSFGNPQESVGRIRLGASSPAMSVVSALVRRLQTDSPGLVYDIVGMPTVQLLHELEVGRVDLVLFAAPFSRLQDGALIYRSLGAERLQWMASPSLDAGAAIDELPPQALLDTVPVWSSPKPAVHFEISVGALENAGLKVRSHCSCNNMPAIVRIVADGGGIALLSEVMTRHQRSSGELVPLPQNLPVAELEYFIVSHRSRHSVLLEHVMKVAVENSPFARAP